MAEAEIPTTLERAAEEARKTRVGAEGEEAVIGMGAESPEVKTEARESVALVLPLGERTAAPQAVAAEVVTMEAVVAALEAAL